MATWADGESSKKLRRVARALYASGAKQEQAPSILDEIESKLGLNDETEIDCWPENWLPLKVFAALETQWNVGMNGVIGLRYEAIPTVLTEFGIKKKARSEMMKSLRIMENEALQVLRG